MSAIAPDEETTPNSNKTVESESNHGPVEVIDDDVSRIKAEGFELIRRIGQGGMGDVYLARQLSPDRSVALKLMRRDWASASALRRFQREIDILGRLKSSGIAQIYGTGIADRAGESTHYLVMEWIEGQDLRQYLTQDQPDFQRRLELWKLLASAVGHAHRRGIVHRDLKPANVMIDVNGAPKVLDFGIARLVDDDSESGENNRAATLTTSGEYLGTLAFSAPEQIDGDLSQISPRTDVYALGVMAHLIFTDTMPLDAGERNLMQSMNFYRSTPVPSLRTNFLRPNFKHFDPDLIAIVDQCVQQDADARYDDGLALAEDLQRFVDGYPVHARTASWWDQTQKFFRRNAVSVSLVGLAALGLIGGSIATYLSAQRANAARAETEIEARRAESVNRFMQTLIGNASPFVSGSSETSLTDALGNTERAIAESNITDAESLSAVQSAVAEAYESLGDFARAMQHAEAAMAATKSLPKARQAEVELILGRVLAREAKYDEAIATMQKALAVMRDNPKQQLQWAAAQIDLNYARFYLGESVQAFAELAKVYPDVQGIFANHPDRLAAFEEDYGELLSVGGQPQAAEPLLNKSLERATALYPIGHPSRISAEMAVASLMRDLKRPDEAVRRYTTLLEQARSSFGVGHSHTQTIMGGLAASLGELNHAEEALPILHELIALRESSLEPTHPKLISVKLTYSTILRKVGDCAKSRAVLNELAPLIDARHPYLNNLQSGQAMDARQRGDWKQALFLYERLIQRAKATQNTLGEERYVQSAAITLAEAKQCQVALPKLRMLYERKKADLGLESNETKTVGYWYAQCLQAQGQSELAKTIVSEKPDTPVCKSK